MNTLEFLTSLRKSGITITLNDDRLEINAPSGEVTESLKNELKLRKKEIVNFLRETNKPREIKDEPITPIARDQDLFLSPSQERVWSLTQLMPQNPFFNMYNAFTIEGPLDALVLENSLQEIIRRHEILRTTFSSIIPPVQIISPEVIFTLSRVDLRKHDQQTKILEIERLANIEARALFDLTSGPLIRAQLLEVDSHVHVFMVTMHHIISDGWSFFVFFKELTTLYETSISHQEKSLPNLTIQYADFSSWHRKWLESEQCEVQVKYWRKELGRDLVPLVLPLDWSRPAQPTTEAASQTRALTSAIVREFATVTTHHGISSHILFLATFLVMLFKYSDQEDLVICTPVSGRNRHELKYLIGFFNNIVPIRIMLKKDLVISEFLENVRIKTLDVFEHQDVPFHHILSESNIGGVPLTRAMFDFQNNQTQSLRLPGTTIETLDIHNGTTNFELALTVFEEGNTYKLVMEYKTSLFENLSIQKMLSSFETVLENIAHNPTRKLSEIPNTIDKLQQETYVKRNEHKQRRFSSTEDGTIIPHTQRNSPFSTKNNEPLVEDLERRNSLESQMTKIWEKLLGKDSIDKDENFFELGGDSLLVLRLFVEIEKVIGESFSPSTIVQAPTIKQLTNVIAKGQKFDSSDLIFPIQVRGSKTPIFAVPFIGDNGRGFVRLSRLLGPDQPFYGFKSVGLDGKEKPIEQIELLAANYIREVESIQPQGPYFLVGFCMGGLVAFEMAQQFHSKGKHVAFLGIMDAWLPHSNPDSAGFKIKKYPRLEVLREAFLRYHKELRGSGFRNWIPHTLKKIQTISEMVKRHDVYKEDEIEKIRRLIADANRRASEAYLPKPYQGKMTYFLASGNRNTSTLDPRFEWEDFAPQGFEMIRIPATSGAKMFAQPYVHELSIHLKTILERVQKERN